MLHLFAVIMKIMHSTCSQFRNCYPTCDQTQHNCITDSCRICTWKAIFFYRKNWSLASNKKIWQKTVFRSNKNVITFVHTSENLPFWGHELLMSLKLGQVGKSRASNIWELLAQKGKLKFKYFSSPVKTVWILTAYTKLVVETQNKLALLRNYSRPTSWLFTLITHCVSKPADKVVLIVQFSLLSSNDEESHVVPWREPGFFDVLLSLNCCSSPSLHLIKF